MTEIKTNLSQTKPDYYKSGKFDTIAFCQYHGLGFCEGNIIKYLVRAGKKGSRMHDLLKATEYLNRLVQEEVEPGEPSGSTTTDMFGEKYNKVITGTEGEYKELCDRCYANPIEMWESVKIPGFHLCDDCLKKIKL